MIFSSRGMMRMRMPAMRAMIGCRCSMPKAMETLPMKSDEGNAACAERFLLSITEYEGHYQRRSCFIRELAAYALPLSPCGRGWRVASGASSEPGEGYFSASCPSPVDPRFTRIDDPLPQARGEGSSVPRGWALSLDHGEI